MPVSWRPDFLRNPAATMRRKSKVEIPKSLALDCEPLVALLPDQAPDAVQAVALVETHVKLELPPLATVLGLALRATVAVGFGLTVTVVDCVALPPVPLQVNA